MLVPNSRSKRKNIWGLPRILFYFLFNDFLQTHLPELMIFCLKIKRDKTPKAVNWTDIRWRIEKIDGWKLFAVLKDVDWCRPLFQDIRLIHRSRKCNMTAQVYLCEWLDHCPSASLFFAFWFSFSWLWAVSFILYWIKENYGKTGYLLD